MTTLFLFVKTSLAVFDNLKPIMQYSHTISIRFLMFLKPIIHTDRTTEQKNGTSIKPIFDKALSLILSNGQVAL